MANISANVTVNFQASQTPASGPLAGTPIQLPERLQMLLRQSGVAADQVDGCYYGQLTLVAATPQTVDVRALTDVLGNSLVPARARVVIFKWYCPTDTDVATVGGAGANEWDGFLSSGGTISVFPSSAKNDGYFILTAPQTTGIPITATSHLLKVVSAAGAGQFDIILFTCSS